jgi:hypothetical protein
MCASVPELLGEPRNSGTGEFAAIFLCVRQVQCSETSDQIRVSFLAAQ